MNLNKIKGHIFPISLSFARDLWFTLYAKISQGSHFFTVYIVFSKINSLKCKSVLRKVLGLNIQMGKQFEFHIFLKSFNTTNFFAPNIALQK